MSQISEEAKAAIEFCRVFWAHDINRKVEGHDQLVDSLSETEYVALREWVKAHGRAEKEREAVFPDQDIRKTAVTDLRLAAAKAWCVVKFSYDCHHTQEHVNQHVAYDAKSTVNDPWFVQAVDGFLAGISHVSSQPTTHIVCDECGSEEVE